MSNEKWDFDEFMSSQIENDLYLFQCKKESNNLIKKMEKATKACNINVGGKK